MALKYCELERPKFKKASLSCTHNWNSWGEKETKLVSNSMWKWPLFINSVRYDVEVILFSLTRFEMLNKIKGEQFQWLKPLPETRQKSVKGSLLIEKRENVIHTTPQQSLLIFVFEESSVSEIICAPSFSKSSVFKNENGECKYCGGFVKENARCEHHLS